MTEEKVTIAIMRWLETKGWKIVAFDFPQSGTGVALRPWGSREKNKGIFIPDILAENPSGNVAIFENKDRYYEKDISKLAKIRETDMYRLSIEKMLHHALRGRVYCGIGIPAKAEIVSKLTGRREELDFVISVAESGSVAIEFQKESLF